jgi:hypothetical protein
LDWSKPFSSFGERTFGTRYDLSVPNPFHPKRPKGLFEAGLGEEVPYIPPLHS